MDNYQVFQNALEFSKLEMENLLNDNNNENSNNAKGLEIMNNFELVIDTNKTDLENFEINVNMLAVNINNMHDNVGLKNEVNINNAINMVNNLNEKFDIKSNFCIEKTFYHSCIEEIFHLANDINMDIEISNCHSATEYVNMINEFFNMEMENEVKENNRPDLKIGNYVNYNVAIMKNGKYESFLNDIGKIINIDNDKCKCKIKKASGGIAIISFDNINVSLNNL